MTNTALSLTCHRRQNFITSLSPLSMGCNRGPDIIFSPRKTFLATKFFYNIFSTWKIFSDNDFTFRFKKFSPSPNCKTLFFRNVKFFYGNSFRFRKFFPTPNFWYYFSDLENFLWHQGSNTVFPTWKIFSDIKFLILFLYHQKFFPSNDKPL